MVYVPTLLGILSEQSQALAVQVVRLCFSHCFNAYLVIFRGLHVYKFPCVLVGDNVGGNDGAVSICERH